MSSRLILGIRNLALILGGLVASGYLFFSLLPIGVGGYTVPNARLAVELPNEMSRRHAFLAAESVAVTAGLPPRGEDFLDAPGTAQTLQRGLTYESRKAYRDDYGLRVLWNREPAQVSSLVLYSGIVTVNRDLVSTSGLCFEGCVMKLFQRPSLMLE